MSAAAGLRDATLNIRISNQQKELIDQAAASTGKTRSSFMVESAVEAAQNALLDQTFFRLNETDWTAFMAVLDAPPRMTPKLRRLLDSTPPWEQTS
jgi:uncharacterized protein (DUF1778 family)